MKPQKILFLTLYTYSLTGGIEKVCRILNEILSALKLESYINLSMYDSMSVKKNSYKAFAGNKISFGFSTVKNGVNADIIILSHINLLVFAKIMKKLAPNKRIILLAHGIEVWSELPNWKKELLNQIEIWAVSKYTAKQLEKTHQIKADRIKILNNCLEKDFNFPMQKEHPVSLLKKHQLSATDKVILTVCRLSSAEQYKGYDLVLLALKDLAKIYPQLIYFLVGKADDIEKNRIENFITTYQLQNHVILTGYVNDEELTDYYQLADVFAMPSKGEGFGIVFLEALANGCKVLAGNADGSTDALLHGELGLLVNPENAKEIYEGLLNLLNKPIDNASITAQQQKIKQNFSFEVYKEKVEDLLFSS